MKKKLKLYKSTTEIYKRSIHDIERVHRQSFLDSPHSYTSYASWKISVLEHEHEKDSYTIFIPDIETLNFLLNMKTSAAIESVLSSTFDICTVGFIFDSAVLGNHIPGFLGMISTMDKFAELTKSYMQNIGVPIPEISSSGAVGQQAIWIASGRKKSASLSVFTKLPLLKLLEVDLENIEQSVDNVYKEVPMRAHDVELSKKEKTLNVLMARLLINIGIYNQATDNKYLIEGLPINLSQNPIAKPDSSRIGSGYVLNIPKEQMIDKQEDGISKRTHIRRAHFRNLRDERFYRSGDCEVGSRWVEVKSALVKGTAYTQEYERLAVK